MARTKMSRHELKSQDEITTTLQRMTEFGYEKKKEIIIGVSAVVVLVLAIIGWNVYAANRNANAQSQLSVTISTFNDTTNIKEDKERYEKTIIEAQKTYDAYRSLPIGAIAQYYLALSHEGLGDTAKATQELQQVIERGDDSIKGVAMFAMAGIHKKHNEPQKAIEVLKQLYDKGGYSKAAVGYELGRVHESANQNDQAKDYYQKVVSEFPDSPFRQDADEGLKRLGVPTPSAAPPASE